MKVITLLVIFLFSSFAANSDLKLKYFTNNSYTLVITKKIGTFQVNDFCQKNSACKALQIAKGKPFKIQPTKAPFLGNPAANYCWDTGAKNRILKDEKNNEYDYCVFDDGSMIDAWNLYNTHHGSK